MGLGMLKAPVLGLTLLPPKLMPAVPPMLYDSCSRDCIDGGLPGMRDEPMLRM